MSEEPKRSTWDIPSDPSPVRVPGWWLDLEREDLPAERAETGQPELVLVTTTRTAAESRQRLSTILVTALVVGFIVTCFLAELGIQGAAGSVIDAVTVFTAAAATAILIVRFVLRHAA